MQKDLKSNDREKRNGRVGKNKGEVEMRREREKGMGRRRNRRKRRRMGRNSFKILTTGEFEGVRK